MDASTLLVDYLRRTALLTGTKWMCREGGCGACVVTQAFNDPITGDKRYRAVNSVSHPKNVCVTWFSLHFYFSVCFRCYPVTEPNWPRWKVWVTESTAIIRFNRSWLMEMELSAVIAVLEWSCPCTGNQNHIYLGNVGLQSKDSLN